VEHEPPPAPLDPLLLEPLLDPLLLEPPLLDPLLLAPLLLPPAPLLPLLPPDELPLEAPVLVQHWMSSGPGHSPAVEVPPCAEHAAVVMHCPDSPFAVHEP